MHKIIALATLALWSNMAFAAGGFAWSHVLFGSLEEPLANVGIDPVPILNMLIVALFLIVVAYIGGKPFRKGQRDAPTGTFDFTYFMEIIVSGIERFIGGIIKHGKGPRPVFALLGTYALFIGSMNLFGLIPGFGAATDQFNVTIVFGLIIFFATHYLGVKQHGPAYIKQFLGPLPFLYPLMFPIEVISHTVRPLSLAIRLFGNMTGDHKVVIVFTSILAVGLPIPFMGLGILVSVLQAFVFVLLSAIYFESALAEAH